MRYLGLAAALQERFPAEAMSHFARHAIRPYGRQIASAHARGSESPRAVVISQVVVPHDEADASSSSEIAEQSERLNYIQYSLSLKLPPRAGPFALLLQARPRCLSHGGRARYGGQAERQRQGLSPHTQTQSEIEVPIYNYSATWSVHARV